MPVAECRLQNVEIRPRLCLSFGNRHSTIMPTITTEQAMGMALAHFNAGRREEARQVCEQIVAAFPQHWPSMLLLGVIRHQSGDPHGGIELLRRAIAVEPNFAD